MCITICKHNITYLILLNDLLVRLDQSPESSSLQGNQIVFYASKRLNLP